MGSVEAAWRFNTILSGTLHGRIHAHVGSFLSEMDLLGIFSNPIVNHVLSTVACQAVSLYLPIGPSVSVYLQTMI